MFNLAVKWLIKNIRPQLIFLNLSSAYIAAFMKSRKIKVQEPSYTNGSIVLDLNFSYAYVHEIEENKRSKAADIYYLFMKNLKIP